MRYKIDETLIHKFSPDKKQKHVIVSAGEPAPRIKIDREGCFAILFVRDEREIIRNEYLEKRRTILMDT